MLTQERSARAEKRCAMTARVDHGICPPRQDTVSWKGAWVTVNKAASALEDHVLAASVATASKKAFTWGAARAAGTIDWTTLISIGRKRVRFFSSVLLFSLTVPELVG